MYAPSSAPKHICLGQMWHRYITVLLNTFVEGKRDIRTFQCFKTHLPKANVTYVPSTTFSKQILKLSSINDLIFLFTNF